MTERVLGRIEPQPPRGIKYMLGSESWLPSEQQSPLRLSCEEWGNLGPMELDPTIKPNKVGFRVRSTQFLAPPGALGFTQIDGIYYWTDTSVWDRMAAERADGEPADRQCEHYGISGHCMRCGNPLPGTDT